MSILDPSEAEAQFTGNWSPQTPIPNKLRQFGYCVNFNELLPGDLILVSSNKPGLIAKAIRKVQAMGGYAKADSRWEHAAIYIGSESVCESERSGVQINSIYKYIGPYSLRIKRNNNLTPDQRWNLVVYALIQKNYSYGFLSVFRLLMKSIRGYWIHQGSPINSPLPSRSVYCSQLFADAHVKACGVPLGNLTSGEATPASLSLDTKLVDVNISWLRIS
ncbi:hypothetical protein [Methylophilus sp. OH31]|uniref:hypothetical protein n=1 Tax=Methylophilus sp. OH31 TaxID=1387312 RepID=UPI0011DDFE52|nr:hypothetical protein [Methylophilus sp. OH31]